MLQLWILVHLMERFAKKKSSDDAGDDLGGIGAGEAVVAAAVAAVGVQTWWAVGDAFCAEVPLGAATDAQRALHAALIPH